jgi:hypothetical protein
VALRDARAAVCLPTDVRAIGAAVGRSKSHIAAMLQIGDKVTDAVIGVVKTLYGAAAEQSALRASNARLSSASRQQSPEQIARVLRGVARKASSLEVVIQDSGASDSGNGAAENQNVACTIAESPAFELVWGTERRLTLSTLGPVSELDRSEAAALLLALEPVLDALQRVAKGRQLRAVNDCTS